MPAAQSSSHAEGSCRERAPAHLPCAEAEATATACFRTAALIGMECWDDAARLRGLPKEARMAEQRC